MALQRIHTGRDAMEAQFLCARLEEAGVAAVLLGDTLTNASGALPIGANAGPGIWVRPEEAARALAIIRQMQQSPSPARSARTPWVCRSCRETVEGQFTDCWNCGASRFQETATMPEPAADPVLATDLPCVRCGYDLRGRFFRLCRG